VEWTQTIASAPVKGQVRGLETPCPLWIIPAQRPALNQVILRAQTQAFSGMKYNATTLQKLERILNESNYIYRYERGTFQSGYCILEQKRVVVLNKFLSVEGRINTLMELIPQLDINKDMLTQESQKTYEEVIKAAATTA
jgi:hypothetical protein